MASSRGVPAMTAETIFPLPPVVEFKPRWVPEYLLAELSNLWHVSRVAMSHVPSSGKTHARLMWTSQAFSKAYPDLSSTAVYKDLYDMLSFGGAI